MNLVISSSNDSLANVIHADYRTLMVLDRMGIKLGFGNKTIEQITSENNINTEAFLIILNLFCNSSYTHEISRKFELIPDFLKYLKKSHTYFLRKKIPAIQENIHQLVQLLHDSKTELVESFYKKYIEEVSEHIEYENETVFPYIEKMYNAFLLKKDPHLLFEEYNIDIYSDHHEDIEDALRDLKNILIRHLPQRERSDIRRIVLSQLFELESDLQSHTQLEDDMLIPLVRELENNLKLTNQQSQER